MKLATNPTNQPQKPFAQDGEKFGFLKVIDEPYRVRKEDQNTRSEWMYEVHCSKCDVTNVMSQPSLRRYALQWSPVECPACRHKTVVERARVAREENKPKVAEIDADVVHVQKVSQMRW